MSKTLIENRERLMKLQKDAADVVKQASADGGYDFGKVKGHGFDGLTDTAAQVDHFRTMNEEMNSLADEVKSLADTHDAAENVKRMGELLEREDGVKSSSRVLHPNGGGAAPVKSLGELITENELFKSFRPGSKAMSPDFALDLRDDLGGGDMYSGVKTLMTTSAGWTPQAMRTGRLVDMAVAPVEMIDLIPSEQTSTNAVVYMEETTLTNAAAETLEGGAYSAAALALTERSSPVRKIAVYLPVTDEQLADIPQVRSYIDNRLPYMVQQRLGAEVLKGNGSSPNLEGVQVRTGVQTYALTSEPVFDAIAKGMEKVLNTGQAQPDGIVINASDWWLKFKLARTTDGIYILGNPGDSQAAKQLWGLTVAPVQQETSGTALVGAFRQFSGLAIRQNLAVSVGFVNDDFIKGQQSIRCELRAALQVYRPAAFCKVTGL